MAANFMTFHDVVEPEDYNLWIGDEGWDLDYYLHENPNLKNAPYAFLTDFIGVLPMRDWRRFRRRSSTSRCAIISSRTSTWPAGSTAWAPASAWDYDTTSPEELASRHPRPPGQAAPRAGEVPTGGTERAARMIANLL